MPDTTKMQSSAQREAPSKNRAPEMDRSQFKLSDGRLTFRPTDGTSYASQDPVYSALQKLGNGQPSSAGLNSPPIKKEFPDENAQQIKTWDKFKPPLAIKQEPGIKQEPDIKMELQEFKHAHRGRLVIDLTEEDDDLSTPKRPIPGPALLMAIYQRQKAAKKPIDSPKISDPFLEADEDDVSGFNEYQKQFQSLQNPSIEQQIEFEKRREEELQRRRKVKNDKLCALNAQVESGERSDGENISSGLEGQPQPRESQPQAQTEPYSKQPATAKRPTTRVSKFKIQKAKRLGLLQLLSKEGARKREQADETEAETEQGPGAKGAQKKPRPPTALSNKEIRSIFSNDDGHKTAKGPLPPVAEKAGARADISILDEATRTFTPSARSDGQGKWRVRGLKTSLMVNQILAAAWMCKRETTSSKPNGGLLCDVMGFGKTLSALACIVNRKVPSEPEGPTLIVAPRNLISTWMSQIRQHCETRAAGSVIAHCSGSRLETDDLAYYLAQQGIVLTTYTEISSSYPNLKPPPGLKTDAAIEEWWEQEYDGKAGVFHQINWHRIILDEGHMIRNRNTRTSIAVRALSGNYKWALTGTPLHNRVDELYALFAFIEAPNSEPYKVFMHNYCNGTPVAKERLINMLRAIIHRKTHESRHLGRPLIELKKFDLKEVKIEFYPVERQIYHAIAERFLAKVNVTRKQKQKKCILTMILKLQMFSSHPLTAEDYLKRVCYSDSALDAKLKGWIKDETSPGKPSPSSIIAKCCIAGKYQTSMPVVPLRSRAASESLRPRPAGKLEDLVDNFKKKIEECNKAGAFYEVDNRVWFCPGCRGLPAKAIITDCQHLYCEECFDALADKEGNTDGVARLCRRCVEPIKTAAFYGIYDDDDFDTPQLDDAESSSVGPASHRKRPAPSGTRMPENSQTKKRRKGKKDGQTFTEWLLADGNPTSSDDSNEEESRDEVEDESPIEGDVPNEEENDKGQDWIAAFGKSMPGSKFDAITSQVKKWFEEDSTAKIVIFTQYVNSAKLLGYLCKENGWSYSEMTGKMANRSREIHLDRFRTDDECKIMIASIKTGGLGLDFSVANKCILVDLWWNEAVQDQAFLRLWRLGQQRDVECIVLMIKESIDDWMMGTQKRKAKDISEVMSQSVLMDRNTLRELLEMFGEVDDDPQKGFQVYLPPKDTSKNSSKTADKAKAAKKRS
ncbi:hypothetical protein N7519_006263 [Penicillium mononematosum]|uniref:uncharacterized protein n=1 Tax=Penicillium mononematosum TaxID=268346 RepID=UPI00254752AE|nr:uncharacterized protein N7519_006263 [Penicillium mononematosum]KAJ6184962.1 hypothetical protein N7519_006263 [Penicillium mononematosum]